MTKIKLYFQSSINSAGFHIEIDDTESIHKLKEAVVKELMFVPMSYFFPTTSRVVDSFNTLRDSGIKNNDIIKTEYNSVALDQPIISRRLTASNEKAVGTLIIPSNHEVRGELVSGKIEELDDNGNSLVNEVEWTLTVKTLDGHKYTSTEYIAMVKAGVQDNFEFQVKVNKTCTTEQFKDELERITGVQANPTTSLGRGQGFSGGPGGRLIFAGTDIQDGIILSEHRYNGGASLSNTKRVCWMTRLFDNLETSEILEKIDSMKQNGAMITEEKISKLIAPKLSSIEISELVKRAVLEKETHQR